MKELKLSDLSKPISHALGKSDVFVRSLFERPESLGELLPYEEYIENEKLFRNKDGSLGAVFEATLLEHEPMTPNEVVSVVDSLKSWFNLPSNCVLQVHFDQSYVSKRDTRFADIASKYPDAHSVSKTLFVERLNRIRDASNKDDQLAPLQRRCFVSLRYFPDVSSSAISKALLRRGEGTLFEEMKDFVQEMRNFSQLLANFEHNSSVKLTRLGAAELLDFLRKFFNPKTYHMRSFAEYNPNLSLSS